MTELRRKRQDSYHSILSPSQDRFPKDLIREDLLKNTGDLNEKFDESRAQKYSNLVGYTAFYRNEGSPAWSMTAPGSTTVYRDSKGKEFSKELLKGSPLETQGKDRFLGNLEKQTYEKELLLKAIQGHIPKEYQFQIQPGDVIKFLRTGELIVTIDKGQEKGTKYKLTLNASYLFYLLGECANESLGVKIGGIDIQKFTTPKEDNSSVEAPHGYENTNLGLYVNTVYTKNQAEATAKERGAVTALGVAIPKDVPEKTDRGNSVPGANGEPGSVPGVDGTPGGSIPYVENVQKHN